MLGRRALHRITHYRGSAFFISTASSLIHCAGSIFLVPRQSNSVIHHAFKPPRPTFADSGRLTSSRPSGSARHHGKPCGAYVGWPRNTEIIPPKMGERIVRPSMYDCHRDFHLAVQTFGLEGTARARARAHMRQSIRGIVARLRERDRLMQWGFPDWSLNRSPCATPFLIRRHFSATNTATKRRTFLPAGSWSTFARMAI